MDACGLCYAWIPAVRRTDTAAVFYRTRRRFVGSIVTRQSLSMANTCRPASRCSADHNRGGRADVLISPRTRPPPNRFGQKWPRPFEHLAWERFMKIFNSQNNTFTQTVNGLVTMFDRGNVPRHWEHQSLPLLLKKGTHTQHMDAQQPHGQKRDREDE